MKPNRNCAQAAAIALLLTTTTLHAQLQPGDDAPPSLGRTRSGESVAVADQVGKVQAVTFWASWCEPCRTELPLLEKLQRALGPDRIRIVAVNIEDRAAFRQATRELSDWKITIAHDPYKDAFTAYQGTGIPHLVIIARDGKIRQVFRGYSEAKVREIVSAVADAVNAQSDQK